jgi:hypothetical protein
MAIANRSANVLLVFEDCAGVVFAESGCGVTRPQ